MTDLRSTPPNAQENELTLELVTQLCVGPSLSEVAADLLRQSLGEKYPDLNINPDTALMGTATWKLVDNRIVAGAPQYQTLSNILARQAITQLPTLCIEGEHFLTQQPLTDPATHLPVRIVEIANLINVLAPVMFLAFKEQMLAYWNQSNGNGPHWHELSNTLRKIWNVQKVDGWTDDDCAMARGLYHSPDPANRRNNRFESRACLIDVDLVNGDTITHTHQVFIAVLVGKSAGKTVILCHSLLNGYQKFDSMAQLGASLPTLMYRLDPYERLQWRLYEPTDDFFAHQACAMITLQIEAHTRFDVSASTPIVKPVMTPIHALPVADAKVSPSGPDLDWYQEALPDWLTQASTSDLEFYARHLKDLASLNSLNVGKTYQDDIPDIRQYALNQLKTELIKDHPEAKYLDLASLRIQVRSQVFWGTFSVPGQVETTTFTLADLALQNLIALPLGNKTLQMDARKPAPSWLTVDYLETLITRVDIGTTYPALIRSKLVDDQAESSRRKTLYTQHLRIQLPLLALQCKIRGEAGIDERGYQYVAAAMRADISERNVDGQAIVIRHLGFIPKRRTTNTQDGVANMYVIGPQHAQAGPCLLYRPLFDPALVQYPSPANLLYAIRQTPELRESVVAWLPDAVRADYTNYVFPGELPSPWAVADFLVEPAKLREFSGPMSLGEEALNGDLFTTLFDANAKALIELADRQSVSNAENRWASLKQAGWLLFNAALPFMGRLAGTATWIWQIVDQLQTYVQAREHGEEQSQWSALTDVLLNLGLAIVLHVATRTHRTAAPAETKPEEAAKTPSETPALTPPKEVAVEQLPTQAIYAPAADHQQPLNSSGAIPRTAASLAKMLDSFKTEKPEDLPAAISAKGPDQHLYRHEQHYYAPVGKRWFEVKLEGDDTVFIVDPKQPQRSGPPLIHDSKGNWFIDTRLRLRGGGRKSRIKSASDKAEAKAEELRTKLAEFEKSKKDAQLELQQTHQAMTAQSPGTSAQAKRQAYLEKLDSQSASYEAARQQLEALNLFTPVADFQQKSLGYVKAQLELNEAGIREIQTTFTPKLKSVLDQLESRTTSVQASHIEEARQMTEMSQAMIKRLDYAQSCFTALRGLALEGLRAIQRSKPRLPAYSSDDLKALQLTLARNLCLEPQSLGTEPGAWSTIGEIVDSADVAVQTLRDVLLERSESRLDEHIETLSSLVEQFKFIDERLQDFPEDFPSHAQAEPIQRLRELLSEFAQRAAAQLAPLHIEQERLRNRPTPPPSPPRPLKKVIRTRFNGVLIGEPRLTPVGLETDLVDIKSPLTHQTIATFHEKTPGVWVQRVDQKSPQALPAAPTLQASLASGQALLDELPTFEERARTQIAKPDRTAIGIEHMFHQHALMLEQAGQTLEEALTQANATESHQASAATLDKALDEAAKKLYQQATEQVRDMIKQQPPTVTGVQWLKNHDTISLKRTVKRRRLKSHTKDYLDEYTITDRSTRSALWYAHFHYSSEQAPNDRFLSARLKTPKEREQGTSADNVHGLDEQQRIAFYRSTINLAQARRVFFPEQAD